ncbi:MAG: MmcQ/YjbR family DNA-binding protein [Bacilli bacterium]|nr:MmcQ/YjbR family DNA-binding protein [Bacilli bacterium]MBR3162022.1 MmcQ/YjbR family DNA-binding protein [Bacilli bacterium]
MSIEEEIFNYYEIDENKLMKYGFKDKKGKLCHSNKIMDDKFEVIIEYDKCIRGKVIEIEFNDEYTNFRRESLGEFSSKIKDEFVNILTDIRDKCCNRNSFIYPQTRRINEFIKDKYNVNPEFLWEKSPGFAIYRKVKKWFALVGNVSRNKVDKDSDDDKEIEIINIKVVEDKVDKLLSTIGYYKAYHMNKKKWISIILDDSIDDYNITELISESYDMVE